MTASVPILIFTSYCCFLLLITPYAGYSESIDTYIQNKGYALAEGTLQKDDAKITDETAAGQTAEAAGTGAAMSMVPCCQNASITFEWEEKRYGTTIEPAVRKEMDDHRTRSSADCTNSIRRAVETTAYRQGLVPFSVMIEEHTDKNAIAYRCIVRDMRTPIISRIEIRSGSGVTPEVLLRLVRVKEGERFSSAAFLATAMNFKRRGYPKADFSFTTDTNSTNAAMAVCTITIPKRASFSFIPIGVRNDENGASLFLELGDPNFLGQWQYLGIYAQYATVREDYRIEWYNSFLHLGESYFGLQLGVRRRNEMAMYYDQKKIRLDIVSPRSVLDAYFAVRLRFSLGENIYLDFSPELQMLTYFKNDFEMFTTYQYIERGLLNNNALNIRSSAALVINYLNSDYLPTEGIYARLGLRGSFLFWKFLRIDYQMEGSIPLVRDIISLRIGTAGSALMPQYWQPNPEHDHLVPRIEPSSYIQANRLHGWCSVDDFSAVRVARKQVMLIAACGADAIVHTNIGLPTAGLSDAYYSLSLDAVFVTDLIGMSVFIDARNLSTTQYDLNTPVDFRNMFYSTGFYIQLHMLKLGCAYDFLYNEQERRFMSRVDYLQRPAGLLANLTLFFEVLSFPIR